MDDSVNEGSAGQACISHGSQGFFVSIFCDILEPIILATAMGDEALDNVEL